MPGPSRARDIADGLRARITAGDLKPGDRLPSTRELASAHDVSSMTVRDALGALVREGLITARQGSGWYVRAYERITSDRIARLAPASWPAMWDRETDGRTVQADPTVVDVAPCPARVAALLGEPAGADAVRRVRRFRVDGVPVLESTSWYPAALVAGTRAAEPDTGPGGVYARLAETGHGPARFREDVTARMPTDVETARFSAPPGTPLLEVTRTAWDGDGRPVEVNAMLLRGDAYVLRYDWTPEAGA